MARLNGISVQTLRYYEKKGLLAPAFKDDETGYRFYHIEQSARLDHIQFLKTLNYTLDEIAEVMQSDCYVTIERSICDKEKKLKEELEDIQYRLNLIDSFTQASKAYMVSKDKREIEVNYLPKRYLYTYEIEQNIYQMETNEYEYSLRLFKNHLQEKNYPFVFSCVGSVLEKEKFIDGFFQSKLMYIVIPEKLKQMSNYILPAGLYAITYCDAFEKELSTVKDFRQNLLDNGYEIVGDYICEVMYEWMHLANQKRDMFIRLQVPIEGK